MLVQTPRTRLRCFWQPLRPRTARGRRGSAGASRRSGRLANTGREPTPQRRLSPVKSPPPQPADADWPSWTRRSATSISPPAPAIRKFLGNLNELYRSIEQLVPRDEVLDTLRPLAPLGGRPAGTRRRRLRRRDPGEGRDRPGRPKSCSRRTASSIATCSTTSRPPSCGARSSWAERARRCSPRGRRGARPSGSSTAPSRS